MKRIRKARKFLAIFMSMIVMMSSIAIAASAASNSPDAKTEITRYSVLVLDMSGSMSGEPLKQLKLGCKKFVEELSNQTSDENYVAIVTFDDYAHTRLNFSKDIDQMNKAIDNLYDDGMTNISAGINTAVSLLENVYNSGVNPNEVISNVLVMSDGLPNEGVETVSGFESLMNGIHQRYNTINFYSFGYYHSLSQSYIAKAEEIMSVIGDYTRVSDGSTLEFGFGELAPVNGAIIRIACPVDVEVSLAGSSAKLNKANTHTYFGDLSFEDNGETKILNLQYRENYTITITGTGSGEMDYTITYTLNGEELHSVKFSDVDITDKTFITTTFNDDTFNKVTKEVLNIDTNGDGKIDKVLEPDTDKKTSFFEKVLLGIWAVIFFPFVTLFPFLFVTLGTIISAPFALIASLFS